MNNSGEIPHHTVLSDAISRYIRLLNISLLNIKGTKMTEHKFPMNNNLETWRDQMPGPTNPEQDVFSNKTPELDVFSNKTPEQAIFSTINPEQGVISSSGCQTKTKISNHKLYQPGNFWGLKGGELGGFAGELMKDSLYTALLIYPSPFHWHARGVALNLEEPIEKLLNQCRVIEYTQKNDTSLILDEEGEMENKELVKNINKNEEKKEENKEKNLSLFSLNNRKFVYDFEKKFCI
ncbi:uncharacterized protein LOC111716285 isoform X2 [Eurytemora carolleeae]|uniref:uncharacterized protein LOC111716285 isoform X2 n=1 Tax=Eurytemora carolleeae TaxID=1294199 RepID=UPI000C76D956|nr:uncharacterized protein LOC111716285 isoform X2 [Eurytemora carolleeae]|eukprot:XP_023347493.1 uncharacterized protein LOC111716285 isoform X2 [Eurytemora affinis]